MNPKNALASDASHSVLVDFGSAREIGAPLGTNRSTKGWIAGEMNDYDTSDSQYDLSALRKIRTVGREDTWEVMLWVRFFMLTCPYSQ